MSPRAPRSGPEGLVDALEMARARRGARRLVGLVAHSDAGSQPGFNRSSQHLLLYQLVEVQRVPLRESANRASFVGVR